MHLISAANWLAHIDLEILCDGVCGSVEHFIYYFKLNILICLNFLKNNVDVLLPSHYNKCESINANANNLEDAFI